MMPTGRLIASRCATRRRHARTRVRSSRERRRAQPEGRARPQGQVQGAQRAALPEALRRRLRRDGRGPLRRPARRRRGFGALPEWRYARGTLAELVAPRAAEVARIPAGVAEADAAALALVGLTALQALRDVAHVGRGA